MKNATKLAYEAFIQRQGELNKTSFSNTEQASFSVNPEIQQKLMDRLQESSAFLGRINIEEVPEQSGQVLGLGVDASIAGRTATSAGNIRQATDPTGMTKNEFFCHQTNFDVALTYANLDRWAKFPDFQIRWRKHILLQMSRDKLKIGWHGTQAAASTNRVTNPLLQDVNIGWLELIRQHESAKQVTDAPKLGANAGLDGWKNLDLAVYDMAQETIAEEHRDSGELVAIVGRKLLTDKYLGLLGNADRPTESNATDMMLTNKTAGGYPVVTASFFPSNAILVTSLKNLSIYHQAGKNRVDIINEPKMDRVAEYRSSNVSYAIEDLDAVALAEGILTEQADGSWS